jgi:hypothetical protein
MKANLDVTRRKLYPQYEALMIVKIFVSQDNTYDLLEAMLSETNVSYIGSK